MFVRQDSGHDLQLRVLQFGVNQGGLAGLFLFEGGSLGLGYRLCLRRQGAAGLVVLKMFLDADGPILFEWIV